MPARPELQAVPGRTSVLLVCAYMYIRYLGRWLL